MKLEIEVSDADWISALAQLQLVGLGHGNDAERALVAVARDALRLEIAAMGNARTTTARAVAQAARGIGRAYQELHIGEAVWVLTEGWPTLRATITTINNGAFRAEMAAPSRGFLSFSGGSVRELNGRRYMLGGDAKIEGWR